LIGEPVAATAQHEAVVDDPFATATDEHAEVTVDLGEADRGTLPTVYQIVQVSQQGLPPGGGWQGDGRQQTQQE
tara:strand:+ start:83 stop:304 length:222 start_codon:yes stop_codon:yes gene_type:complete